MGELAAAAYTFGSTVLTVVGGIVVLWGLVCLKARYGSGQPKPRREDM